VFKVIANIEAMTLQKVTILICFHMENDFNGGCIVMDQHSRNLKSGLAL
jgi:hypothetical protein